MHRLKILITGISGFIGRSLVEEIVNRNLPWDIYGIDIKEPVFNDAKYLQHIDFKFADIRHKENIDSIFKQNTFDGVVHLAAVSRVVDAEKDKKRCIETNYNGTKYIVENVAKNPDTWLVFGSSREVYGEQTIFPVKESAVKKPINIYGECKLKGEVLVEELINKYVILRFSNVYGNNYDIKGRVIPAFINQALKDEILYLEGGDQIIDFTFIEDTVNSIINSIELLQTNKIVSEKIHISPGTENKITDIISYLESFLNKKLKVKTREKRNYDVVRFIGDSTHRKELLGGKDFISLKEGIKILLHGMTRN